MSYQLYLGDFLEMLQLPDQVDAIITDLPYGTTQCDWDSVLPLGLMWGATDVMLKKGGAFITTACQPFTTKIIASNMKNFKYDLVWDKVAPVGFLNAKKQPMRSHESILIFCDEETVYNPQMRNVSSPFGKLSPSSERTVYGSHGAQRETGVGYPSSILKYMRPNNMTGGGYHPTQKPVALYEYLVRTYTNPGDTVLDFCMGSGTTGVACIRTGRKFIGIEREQKYFEIAEKRIKNAQPPLFVDA